MNITVYNIHFYDNEFGQTEVGSHSAFGVVVRRSWSGNIEHLPDYLFEVFRHYGGPWELYPLADQPRWNNLVAPRRLWVSPPPPVKPNRRTADGSFDIVAHRAWLRERAAWCGSTAFDAMMAVWKAVQMGIAPAFPDFADKRGTTQGGFVFVPSQWENAAEKVESMAFSEVYYDQDNLAYQRALLRGEA